jgi:hypothetical protein
MLWRSSLIRGITVRLSNFCDLVSTSATQNPNFKPAAVPANRRSEIAATEFSLAASSSPCPPPPWRAFLISFFLRKAAVSAAFGIHSLSSRVALRYPRGVTVHVARPTRSIPKSEIKRTCLPSRDRRCCCNRALPRSPADLQPRTRLHGRISLPSTRKVLV